GNSLILTLAISFAASFGGSKNLYMEANDGSDSGWQQRGTWTVPASLPTTVSVTPSSGTGSSQTFSFLYSDVKGGSAITTVSVIINGGLSTAGGCYLLYSRQANS